MKTKTPLLLLLLLTLSGPGIMAQKVTGSYYGIGNVSKDGNYSQYLSELILVQKGNKVTGEYNYYFKSSYVPAKVAGFYNSETRVLELQIFPLLNYKAANYTGADCPMKGYFVLKVSRVETSLSGQFEPSDHYKYTCPDIVLKLKKEVLTPEQKKKLQKTQPQNVLAKAEAPEQDENGIDKEVNTIAKNTKVAAPSADAKNTGKAQNEHTIALNNGPSPVQKNAPATTTAASNTPQQKPPVTRPTSASKQGDANKQPTAVSNKTPLPITIISNNDKPTMSTAAVPAPVNDPAEMLVRNLRKRTFEKTPVIEVDADSLQIALYDNGEVDDDTVALFHNRKLIAHQQRLSDKAINFTIHIDTTVNEISMYAENLGRIPPNTAVCVIMAGDKRYELALSSNYITNGTIRFKKKTPEQIAAEENMVR